MGQHLVPRLEAQGLEVVATDLELDVADGPAVAARMREIAPGAVIHLAALSSVAWTVIRAASKPWKTQQGENEEEEENLQSLLVPDADVRAVKTALAAQRLVAQECASEVRCAGDAYLVARQAVTPLLAEDLRAAGRLSGRVKHGTRRGGRARLVSSLAEELAGASEVVQLKSGCTSNL